MSSWVKYFAQTFECRIVNSFLSDSQFSRQGLVLYLQCRRLAKTMTKLRSADEFYLTKKELIKFVAVLKNDDSQELKDTILEWVQQELQFLREIDVYKLDTSGLTGYLLKFFTARGEIAFSYLLEFLLKDFFLENNRRVIIDICSKLKIGNIGTFVTNLSKYNSAQTN
jgi:single-stranded DNA-specific DHH superfamily exonuclease